MRKAYLKLHASLPLLFISLVVGCGNGPKLSIKPESFEFASDKKDLSAERTVVIKNIGSETLELSKFECELSDDYKLQWFKIDSETGKRYGPPRIAGVINGRKLFPTVIDIPKGMGVALVLKHLNDAVVPPAGKLVWKTNVNSIPELKIVIEGEESSNTD